MFRPIIRAAPAALFVQLLAVSAIAETIATRFTVPEGYRRVAAADGSYAAWLRQRPLDSATTDALDWQGNEALTAGTVGGVLRWQLLGSMEQCADVAIRLVAEYARAGGVSDSIVFRSLSGQTIGWQEWRQGRYAVNAEATAIVYRPGVPDTATKAFTDYLRFVMMYANTASLARDWPAVGRTELAIGDVLIQPYRAGDGIGHLSIIVDACEHETGARRFLWVDGYIPARVPVVRQRTPGDPESAWMTPEEYLRYVSQFGPGRFHRFPGWARENRD